MLDGIIDEFLGKNKTIPNIIEFIEAGWGWRQKMFPTQKFIFKLIYGLPLDSSERIIRITDKFNDKVYDTVSERKYFDFLVSEGRINIDTPPEKPFFEIVEAIGRRGTKSSMASFLAGYELYKLVCILKDPQAHYGLTRTDQIRVVLVGSDKNQAQVIFNQIKEGASNSDAMNHFISNEQAEKMLFFTQAQIEKFKKDGISKKEKQGLISAFVGTANARSARGTGSIVIIMDEMAHFMTNSGVKSDNAVYDALTPAMTSFGMAGKIVCISSPLAKKGKFYDLYTNAMEGNTDILAVRIPTWGMNPTIDSDYLKNRFKIMGPISYGCEFGANFSESKNVWLSDERVLLDCMDPEYQQPGFGTRHIRYYWGLDLGLKDDALAMAVTHKEGEKVVLDYKKEYFGNPDATQGPSDRYYEFSRRWIKMPQDYEDIVAELTELKRRFTPSYGMLDQHSGTLMLQILEKNGIKNIEEIHFTESLNSQMYELWRIIMTQKQFLFQEEDSFIKQVLALEEERRSKGINIVSAPQRKGFHDDLADAVVRAVWGAVKGSPKNSGGKKGNAGQPVSFGGGSAFGASSTSTYGQYLMQKMKKNPGFNRRG